VAKPKDATAAPVWRITVAHANRDPLLMGRVATLFRPASPPVTGARGERFWLRLFRAFSWVVWRSSSILASAGTSFLPAQFPPLIRASSFIRLQSPAVIPGRIAARATQPLEVGPPPGRMRRSLRNRLLFLYPRCCSKKSPLSTASTSPAKLATLRIISIRQMFPGIIRVPNVIRNIKAAGR